MYKFVSDKYLKTNHFGHGPFDETFYSMRVYETAKEIISLLKENVHVQQVLVACILHDIGKVNLKVSKILSKDGFIENEIASKEWISHPIYSLPIARKFLQKLGHSQEFIEEILYLVENHSKRGDRMKERTLELKIMQDADLISDVGIAGFIRTFAYSGKFSSVPLIESIKFIQKADRTLHGHKINLKISEKLYKREYDIQQRLAREMYTKIDSDLLN